MRVTVCAALAACVLAVPAAAQQQQPATVPVGVVKAELKPVADTLEFVGRVDAINRVEVRARVTGFLENVLFKEGDPVTEGAPLYRIEQGLFQAAVEQAQGALERSKAGKVLSEIQFQRAQELLDRSAGTVVARDQAKAADQQAQGAVMTDEANLATAKINLGYTDIVSPIDGEIGRTNITKGNVVSPDSGVLTVIVSVDPMYAQEVSGHRYHTVRNVTRWDRWGLVVLAVQLLRILLIERPRVVVTTGAAPGAFAIGLSKLMLRSKTIWIDSIANCEEMSSSGWHARRFADAWLTQWPHLKGAGGPDYWGAVI